MTFLSYLQVTSMQFKLVFHLLEHLRHYILAIARILYLFWSKCQRKLRLLPFLLHKLH